jgi:hypothetical protein
MHWHSPCSVITIQENSEMRIRLSLCLAITSALLMGCAESGFKSALLSAKGTVASESLPFFGDQLAFLTSPQFAETGSCSQAVGFQAQNNSGESLTLMADLTVTLSATPSDLQFFADDECATGISQIVLSKSSNYGIFFFKGESEVSAQITLSNAELKEASQEEIILTASPNPSH